MDEHGDSRELQTAWRERQRLIWVARGPAHISQAILGASAVTLLWTEYPHWQLLCWYGALLGWTVTRHLGWLRVWRDDRSVGEIRRHAMVGIVACGIVWGLFGLLFFPADPFAQFLLALFVVSAAASAWVSLVEHDWLAAVVIAAGTAPVCTRLLVAQGWQGAALILVLAVSFVPFLLLLQRYRRATLDAREAQGRQRDVQARLDDGVRRLAATSAELSSLLEAADQVGIIATDLDGVITRFNSGAEQLLGYRAAELVGKATPGVFHLTSEMESRGAEVSRQLGREIAGFEVFVWSAREGRDERRHWTYVRRDGSHITVDLMISGMRDASGQLIGFLGIALDVTREIAAQRAERELNERFSLAANAASVGVWEWVSSTNEILWDVNMYRIYGIEPGKRISPKDWQSWVHPENDAAVLTATRTILKTGDPFEIETKLVPPHGREIWVRSSAVAIRGADGRVARMIGVQVDNTRVHQADRLKAEFVATVSHELRTPLTSIRGSLGLLVGGAAGELPRPAQQLLNIAHDNAERLLLLVNDILDVSRIEAGRLEMVLEQVLILPLVQRAIRSNEGFAATCDAHLVLADVEEAALSTPVTVDTHRFLQVLANLLSNAAKFSPPGGIVEIGVMRVEHAEGQCLRIEVRDRGPGIAPAFRERIFQKFSQADSSDTRAKGGTGLGLAISKMLVDRLQGGIGFVARPGGGTVFYVELPVATPAVE